MKAAIVSIVIVIALARAAHAQPIDLAALADPAAPDGVAAVETGVDQGIVARVGYTRRAHLGDLLATTGAAITVPIARPDLGDLRADLGGTVVLIDRGTWKVGAGGGVSARTTDDPIARLVAIGASASVVGGAYRGRWFAAIELGFDAALATHVAHHDAYRELVYPEAADGWYRFTGGTFREGVQLGVRAGSIELTARAGRLQTLTGDAPLMPIYLVLGASRAF